MKESAIRDKLKAKMAAQKKKEQAETRELKKTVTMYRRYFLTMDDAVADYQKSGGASPDQFSQIWIKFDQRNSNDGSVGI